MEENVPSKENHCCDVMDSILERGDSALIYSPDIRSYTIREIIKTKKKIEIGAANRIRYCPWCSTKLPKSLDTEFVNILKKEYQLTEFWNPKEVAHMPAEFKTDEWWKKRGL